MHWGATAWLTGHIRPDQLEATCAELDRERQAQRVIIQIFPGPVAPNSPRHAHASLDTGHYSA